MKGSQPCKDPGENASAGRHSKFKGPGVEYLGHLRERKKSSVTGVGEGG